jgi:hypothetical protein
MLKTFPLLIFILLFYVWTATFGYFDFNLKNPNNNYYNVLADGFLKRQLNLPVKVPEKLIKASHPFNPEFNKEFRQTFDQLERRMDVDDGFLDLSFYKNKLYAYFGPSPVFAIYLPYRFLTGLRISDSLALTILSFGILILSFLILLFMQKNYFSNLPPWIIPLNILVIGFSNVTLYFLRRPAVYGVAICGGTFFLLSAIYFLFMSMKSKSYNLLLLFLSGVSMAFSVGARPNLLISCGFIISLYFFQNKSFLSKKNLLNIVVLSFPLIASLLLLISYNHLRFGSITDFGYLHQLSALDFDLFKSKFFDLKSMPFNSFVYLFFPPFFDSHFPFIRHGHFSFEFQPEFYTKTTGIIYAVPFLLMFAICLVSLKAVMSTDEKLLKSFPKFEFYCLFGSGIVNMLTVSCYLGVNMKYVTDFISLLLLSLCVLLLFCFNSLNVKSSDYKVLSVTSFFLGFLSIVFGALFSIEGQFTGLKIQNPEQYKIIESVFNSTL